MAPWENFSHIQSLEKQGGFLVTNISWADGGVGISTELEKFVTTKYFVLHPSINHGTRHRIFEHC